MTGKESNRVGFREGGADEYLRVLMEQAAADIAALEEKLQAAATEESAAQINDQIEEIRRNLEKEKGRILEILF